MIKKSARFYKEFDFFLSEVLKERGKKKGLSGDWLSAGMDLLGASKMKTLIPVLAVLGVALLPSFVAITSIVGAAVASKSVYKAVSRKNESVLPRLERAKHLFQSLSRMAKRGNADAKDEIDQLFDDLVMGRDFIS